MCTWWRTFHKVGSSCSWKGSRLLRRLPVNITGSWLLVDGINYNYCAPVVWWRSLLWGPGDPIWGRQFHQWESCQLVRPVERGLSQYLTCQHLKEIIVFCLFSWSRSASIFSCTSCSSWAFTSSHIIDNYSRTTFFLRWWPIFYPNGILFVLLCGPKDSCDRVIKEFLKCELDPS